MTTDAAKPTAHRREGRSMLIEIDDALLLPLGLKRVPKPIAEANQAAHEALGQLREADRLAGEAAAQAEAAPEFDRLAAIAAADAGEAPPTVTTERKQKAAEEARRAVQAARVVGARRVRALYDAVEDHFDAYLGPRQELAEQAAAPMEALVEDLLQKLISFRTENRLYQLARAWHNNPNSAILSDNADHAAQLTRAYEKALEGQRRARQFRHNRPIENELPDLLAAITLKIEDELGTG